MTSKTYIIFIVICTALLLVALLSSCVYIDNIGIPETPDFRYMQSARVLPSVAMENAQRCTDGLYVGKKIAEVKTDAGKRFMEKNPDGSGKIYTEYLDYFADEGTTKAYWLGNKELHGITVTFYTDNDGIVTKCVAKDERMRR